MKIIKTPIEGLKIKLNKVIGDRRGYLCEMAPSGKDNEFLIDGIGNIYSAIASGKGVFRGGHYHHQLVENFYTLSGIALWLFKDFRQASPTFNQSYGIITGEKEKSQNLPKGFSSYLLPESLAQIWVPAGVYHVYFPLSRKTVRVIAVASLPYDDKDYVRFFPEEDPDLKKLLIKAGLC